MRPSGGAGTWPGTCFGSICLDTLVQLPLETPNTIYTQPQNMEFLVSWNAGVYGCWAIWMLVYMAVWHGWQDTCRKEQGRPYMWASGVLIHGGEPIYVGFGCQVSTVYSLLVDCLFQTYSLPVHSKNGRPNTSQTEKSSCKAALASLSDHVSPEVGNCQ